MNRAQKRKLKKNMKRKWEDKERKWKKEEKKWTNFVNNLSDEVKNKVECTMDFIENKRPALTKEQVREESGIILNKDEENIRRQLVEKRFDLNVELDYNLYGSIQKHLYELKLKEKNKEGAENAKQKN